MAVFPANAWSTGYEPIDSLLQSPSADHCSPVVSTCWAQLDRNALGHRHPIAKSKEVLEKVKCGSEIDGVMRFDASHQFLVVHLLLELL